MSVMTVAQPNFLSCAAVALWLTACAQLVGQDPMAENRGSPPRYALHKEGAGAFRIVPVPAPAGSQALTIVGPDDALIYEGETLIAPIGVQFVLSPGRHSLTLAYGVRGQTLQIGLIAGSEGISIAGAAMQASSCFPFVDADKARQNADAWMRSSPLVRTDLEWVLTTPDRPPVTQRQCMFRIDTPVYRNVQVKSVPAQANILINGKRVGVTDADVKIRLDRVIIVLKKAGYYDLAQQIEVAEDTKTITAVLMPVKK